MCITLMASKVKNEEVVYQLKVMDLKEENVEGINFIKRENPYQIDWSNIPDYMHNKKFLKLAQLCSVDDTVHTCHFMNWPAKMFGTYLFDYVGCQ